MMKNDLEDTEAAVDEDTKFAADLAKQCKVKQAEWDERCKMRSEELLAIADTIKILNSDDALELFKKTLPGSSSSFVQMTVSTQAMKARALSMIRDLRSNSSENKHKLDFILLC